MFDSSKVSVWDHLEDLRIVLIRSFCVMLVGILIAFYFYPQIFEMISYPLTHSNNAQSINESTHSIFNPGPDYVVYRINETSSIEIPANQTIEVKSYDRHPKLIILGPIDGFLSTLQLSFWIGIVATSPIWLYFLITFVLPALYHHERQLILPFLILTLFFFSLGSLFAYFVTIPFANQFLYHFNSEIGTNFWSLSNYLNYTLTLILGNGLAFELCAILFLLIHHELITYQQLVMKRRHAVVICLFIGALLTPPDIFTQLMLALPLFAMYEMMIVYARRISKKNINF